MPKEEYIQVCPKCESPDIETDFSTPADVLGGMYPHTCNNCKHVGKIFPEINVKDLKHPIPKDKKLRKTGDSSKLVDKNYEKDYMSALKVFGPIGIFIGIIMATANLFAGLIVIIFSVIFTYMGFRKKK